MTETRTETDSLGPIDVPAAAYWGAQTQRSIENFPFAATERMPIAIVHALALVKQAAARVNRAHGLAADNGRRDRGRRGGGRRGQARRPVPARHLADRQRHADQHERQRGDRRPRQRDADGHARRQGAGPSQRPRQHEPVVERQLPDRAAHRGVAGGRRKRLFPALDRLQRCAGREGGAPGTTSSRSAARTCRTRRR